MGRRISKNLERIERKKLYKTIKNILVSAF